MFIFILGEEQTVVSHFAQVYDTMCVQQTSPKEQETPE